MYRRLSKTDTKLNYERLAEGLLKGLLEQKTRRLRYCLIQGDCRRMLRYIKPESIDQIITSPPYYMQAKYGGVEGEKGTKGTLQQYIRDLLEVFIQCHRVLKPTGLFMLNIDNAKRQEGFTELSPWDWIPPLRQIGFKLIQTLIWVDRGRRELKHPKILDHHYEPIFILAKDRDYTFNWQPVASLYAGDVWEITNPRKDDIEEGRADLWDRSGIATFAVELITQLVTLGSKAGDTILDPFLGSGTTMDVAQRLGRNCIGIEINMGYCKTIMERCFTKENHYRFITQGELERGESLE